MHCLKRGIMSRWNLRRCNPVCRVVYMVSVKINGNIFLLYSKYSFAHVRGPSPAHHLLMTHLPRVIRNSFNLTGAIFGMKKQIARGLGFAYHRNEYWLCGKPVLVYTLESWVEDRPAPQVSGQISNRVP